jgi:hypothetical protein
MIADLECVLPELLEGLNAAYRGQVCIGGVSVRIIGSRSQDVTFDQTLAPFFVEAGDSDIDIGVEWVPELSRSSARKLFDSGTTWRLYECEAGFQFDFGVLSTGSQLHKRLLVDQRFRRAVLQMNAKYFTHFPEAADPLGYPLDELLIMHRLTQERAIELHGCGIVGPEGASNLFVGHSGAGKSTTTRLWTAHEDVDVLSDDRIIVRDHSGQIFMYGTPWHGEAAFASPGRAPLRRIFILEHGRENVLTRLSKSQAVAELFARSFVPFHRHEYVDSALSFLEYVADSIPCYRYAFEPEQAAVERILELRD